MNLVPSLQHDDFVREFHLQVAARQASDALDAIIKDPRAVSGFRFSDEECKLSIG